MSVGDSDDDYQAVLAWARANPSPPEPSLRQRACEVVRSAVRDGIVMYVDGRAVATAKADARFRDDLEFMLQDGRVQEAALEELGVPVVRVGVMNEMAAVTRRRVVLAALAAVSGHGAIPRELLGSVVDSIAALTALDGFTGEHWQVALATFMEVDVWRRSNATPYENLDALLGALRASVAAESFPAKLLRPTPERRRAAANALVALDGARGRGRPLTPWGAAARVAAALGLPMPKRSQATRGKKAHRIRVQKSRPE